MGRGKDGRHPDLNGYYIWMEALSKWLKTEAKWKLNMNTPPKRGSKRTFKFKLINPSTQKKKEGESTTEDKNEEESLNSKSVKFKSTPSNTKETPKTLIYTDKGFLAQNLDVDFNEKKATSALTFLEITIIIDGTSGINCGEVFKIDGVPEVYNMNGFFQVTNVKHQIENEGWKTVVEAGYRVNVEAVLPKA